MNQKQQIDLYCRRYKIVGMTAQMDETIIYRQKTTERKVNHKKSHSVN